MKTQYYLHKISTIEKDTSEIRALLINTKMTNNNIFTDINQNILNHL